jgi:hypothetical protein
MKVPLQSRRPSCETGYDWQFHPVPEPLPVEFSLSALKTFERQDFPRTLHVPGVGDTEVKRAEDITHPYRERTEVRATVQGEKSEEINIVWQRGGRLAAMLASLRGKEETVPGTVLRPQKPIPLVSFRD